MIDSAVHEPDNRGLAVDDLLALLERGPLGVLVCDDDDAILWHNHTIVDWLGIGADRLHRSRLQDLLPPADRIFFDTTVRPILHLEGTVREVAFDLVDHAGARHPVLINCTRRSHDGRSPRTEFAILHARDRRSYERELLRERQRAERSERQLTRMFDVVAAMTRATTREQVLDIVTNSATFDDADHRCSVWLLDERRQAATRVSERTSSQDPRPTARWNETGDALDELAAGELVVLEHITDSDRARYPVLTEQLVARGVAAAVLAPLFDGDELVGALTFGFERTRTFDQFDRRHIATLAARTSDALVRARLHEREQRARRRAEIRGSISAALNRGSTTIEVANAIAVDGAAAFDAAAIGVYLDWDDVLLSLTTASATADDDIALPATIDLGTATIVAGSIADLQPRFVEQLDARDRDLDDSLCSSLDGTSVRAAAVLPIGLSSDPLGVVVVCFAGRTIPPGTRSALRGLVAEASVAVGRARDFDLERRVAHALQASMLPDEVPSNHSWRADLHYAAASHHLEVGGDFYDVLELPDDVVGVVVGDVVGHGLRAASTMGQLRSAARALVVEGQRPHDVITGLGRFSRVTQGALFSTVWVGAFHPDGTIEHASAGHPAPLLVHADGNSRFLADGRSGVLGLPGDVTEVAARATVDPGDVVVIYTDGLTERRGEIIDIGMQRLQAVVETFDFGADEPARRLTEAMVDAVADRDDVVVLILRRR